MWGFFVVVVFFASRDVADSANARMLPVRLCSVCSDLCACMCVCVCVMEAENILCLALLCHSLSLSLCQYLSISLSLSAFSQESFTWRWRWWGEEPATTGIWAHRAALIRRGLVPCATSACERSVCVCVCVSVCVCELQHCLYSLM